MLPFQLRKLGHVVLNVTDLEASVRFYTGVLGLEVSDRYPDTMVPGGMVFMRCNADHHGIALVGGMAAASTASELHHLAFEVATLDEVFLALHLLWPFIGNVKRAQARHAMQVVLAQPVLVVIRPSALLVHATACAVTTSGTHASDRSRGGGRTKQIR